MHTSSLQNCKQANQQNCLRADSGYPFAEVAEASSAPGAVPEVGWHTKDGVVGYEEHMSRWQRTKKRLTENVERCVELKTRFNSRHT